MKFDVTPELACVLKTLRVRNGVSGKDLAAHMGKSPSYLSKLEGGAVRTILEEQLKDMLIYMCDGADFYEVVLPDVAQLLLGSTGTEGFISQVWFQQFDVIERPVEVPSGMAADIARGFDGLHVTPAQVTEVLNANFDSQMGPEFPANTPVLVDYDGSERLLIRVDFAESAVEQVIRGTAPQTSYFILYNIVYAMFRMQRFLGVGSKLPPADAAQLLDSAADYMGRWGVHSLSGYSHFLSSDAFIAHQLPLAGAQAGIVERIAAQLDDIVSHDSMHAINELNTFYRMLEWDPAFAIKLLGLPFADLGQLSFSNKRKLLAEIEQIIENYDKLDEFERRHETY